MLPCSSSETVETLRLESASAALSIGYEYKSSTLELPEYQPPWLCRVRFSQSSKKLHRNRHHDFLHHRGSIHPGASRIFSSLTIATSKSTVSESQDHITLQSKHSLSNVPYNQVFLNRTKLHLIPAGLPQQEVSPSMKLVIDFLRGDTITKGFLSKLFCHRDHLWFVKFYLASRQRNTR